jgi:hypothetical protein
MGQSLMSQTLYTPETQGNARGFSSILFEKCEAGTDAFARGQPMCFADLNLDQIVASITAGREEYNLKSFFYTPLAHVEAINYRHEIFRDIENPVLLGYIEQFALDMQKMREHLAQADKLYYKRQKQSWFLQAAHIYCSNIERLTHSLSSTDLRSRGFASFLQYLQSYAESEKFTSLVTETATLRSDLAGTKYSLFIEGSRIEVHRFASEPDYGAEVLQTFAKFREEAGKEYRFNFPAPLEMNHVEAAVLDRVAKLYPDIFFALDEYCMRRHEFLDGIIGAFDREIQFYLACIESIERYKTAGLPFCYPTVADESKEVRGREVFDLALADNSIRDKSAVVTNDFYLRDPERIFIVSGPNQGGKTTFARTFGQMHYLASLGCPVPGREARLFLFDRMFTHFESEEDIQNLNGKLEDDLIRIQQIFEAATSRSILIMNESFASTALDDALFLSKEILEQIIQRDMLCVSVTFLDELASLGETTVSMVSAVDPANPALRTFKIVRKPADGLAYAQTIAEKYNVTYESVRRRIAS